MIDPTDALRERQKEREAKREGNEPLGHEGWGRLGGEAEADLTQALDLLDGCHKKQQEVYEAFEQAHEQELALRQELTKAQERIKRLLIELGEKEGSFIVERDARVRALAKRIGKLEAVVDAARELGFVGEQGARERYYDALAALDQTQADPE